jgi:hypothetical protein
MNNKFDELAKEMAQATTRRGAFKKFGVGLAGIAVACFGLVTRAEAKSSGKRCWKQCMNTCVPDLMAQGWLEENAIFQCQGICSIKCGF